MADSINPEDAEVIGQIRKFEEELFKTHNFKLYRNYHVPEYHVMNSKRVLSFGIGADAHFEKLICVDNRGLDVRMFDPTPATKFYPVAYGPKNGTFTFYPPEGHKDNWNKLPVPASYSLVNLGNNLPTVDVECKNITTIMKEFEWDSVDILKTDVEGLWYEVGKEIANLDVKFWVTEIELTVGTSIEQAFDKVRELYNLHQTQYNIYINRKRDKKMMELIFIRKDVDES
jgi:FkbM family methyltransferase